MRSLSEYLIKAENVQKVFPGVLALKGVDFDLKPGEVHALIGENGAGKSTLVKILSGVLLKDGGTIYYDGKPIEFNTPREAQDWGISIIFQEMNLCQHLTVAQNIFIGREKSNGFLLDEKKQNEAARKILDSLNATDISPTDVVSTLAISKQQIVEISKALSVNSKVLIMDEPTSSLSDNEIEELFKIIRKLKKSKVGIIYISHRLDELSEIVDRVSVFRDGEYIASLDFCKDNVQQYIQMMVGRELDKQYPRVEMQHGEEILSVSGINRGKTLKNCAFNLYKGEILAFAGLDGSGRTELARAIFGADPVDSMELKKNGQSIQVKSVRDAIKNGITYAPEDRKRQGLAIRMTVQENITLSTMELIAGLFGYINKDKDQDMASRMIKRLNIKTPSIWQKVCNLSGGNQQKLVIAKWLLKDPDILIFDEPTRGIDVGAKTEIYNILNDLKARGKAIILISSELPEVLGVSDRVLVMCDGQVKTILNTAETNQEEIMWYATQF